MTQRAEAAALTLLRAIIATAEENRPAAIAACDAALATFAPPHPELAPFHEAFREEADWWAEFAPHSMQVAYLAAILKTMETRPPVAAAARKRALVAIWNSLTPEERSAFLAHVEEHPGERV